MKRIILLFGFLQLVAISAVTAQHTIRGVIKNAVTKETEASVSVIIKNTTQGTFSDDKGRFSIKTKNETQVTLVATSTGFEPQEIAVQNPAAPIEIFLNPRSELGQEVVVSASRMVQRKLTSPVTIEQISRKDIINSPQLNYLDMVQGLRGVDVTVSSLGFTSITTRGFNTSGNTNFTQIIDGMDNQAPGLNFPLGSAIAPTNLDVENVEMLTGASSALYGSRGLNGTLVTTTKDPFKYQGFSFLITQGVNHVNGKKYNDPVPASPYYDWSARWAKRINDKWAYKINVQYTRAKDWVANDSTNKNGPGNRYTDPGYNAPNYYGSATSIDINPFLMGALEAYPEMAPIIDPLLADGNPHYVARTGYPEYGYLDNNAKLLKTNVEIRYNISPRLQAIVSGTYGTGNIVYTNDTRYQIKDFKVGQYRIELKSDKWFLRAYTTSENSGRTLIAGPTAQYINEAWKPSYDGNTGGGWYPDYTIALLTAMAGGASYTDASLTARTAADQGRLMPGTAAFNRVKDSISTRSIADGGTLFLDRTKMYNAEGQYNLSQYVKFMDLIVGVNWRLFRLNSKNTLFPDKDGPINVNEYSAYLQASKKLFDNRLTTAASFRYDKNTLFNPGRITSRASMVLQAAKENYIRFSYQNAYSFPSNIQALQNTLNGMNSFSSGGALRLLNGVYQFDQYQPYTQASVQKYRSSKNPADLQKFIYDGIKPQIVNAFELGYAAVIAKRVYFDILGYYATWKNFIGYANVMNTPGSTKTTTLLNGDSTYTYNVAFNGRQQVYTYGYAASVSVDLTHNYMFKVNYYADYMKNKNVAPDPTLTTANTQVNNFNTPKYHINFDFGNSGLGKSKKISFDITGRYKPGYYYVVTGGLADGRVPASFVMDAQVSYKLIKARSGIRLGATNLTNKYYTTGVANPSIGGVYYVSYAYNIF